MKKTVKTKVKVKVKPNKWQKHIKKTMQLKTNKGKTLKEILKAAKVTYKK